MDKPAGPTSHDVVAATRRALRAKRIGHAGTLDPGASGLLVVLVGRATRLMPYIGMVPKRYSGTVRTGFETSTDDAAGDPTLRDTAAARWDAEAVRRAAAAVQAQTLQQPPAVSAKKIAGERAYRRVRRGEDVELTPVPVTIYRLEPGIGGGEPEGCIHIAVECSAGTYIRAIARDLGRALGTRAHLLTLRRTGIGAWDVRDALPFDAAFAEQAPRALRPMVEAVAHLPRVALDAAAARRFRFGQKLPVAEAPAGPLAVFDGDVLLGIGETRAGLLCPAVGLAS